ncbi:hypothetical protein SAMN05444483_1272 [Salegentibacter echinorum]|uniref:Uncharacterized protein n=1 Tax=Salegentibacter echinorum TaxID=1073325 RepID=A0A1M5MCA2_SALEC|nr:hypothetical protein [Salegentibacter echinorum]SHG74897.1 hypothetical protein SAMN05444483_1272 [Salegentibacter echinorum]
MKKIYFTLFFIVLFASCEKENIDELLAKEKIKENEFQIINGVKIKDIADKKAVNKVLKYFDKKSFKGKSKENNFRIIGDEARLMKKGDSKSYTFQIEHNTQTGSIENLVLNLEKDGTYQAYIATYHLNTADKRAVVEHGKLPPLKNKVSLTPIEFNAEAIITNLDQKGSGGCYAYVEVIETSRATGWEVTGYRLKRVPCSGNGGGNSGGGSGSDNPGGPSGGSDPGHDGGLPSGGGGGGNGGSLPPPSSSDPGPNHDSIDGTDIMTAPIMRLNTIGKLQDLLELGRFDSPKMEWLRKSASADQIFDLYNFIQEEQESEEAKAFGKEVIDAFMNGGEVDFLYKVIVDDSFKENECLNDVYTEMGKAPTFDNYLKNFDLEMSVANLKFGAKNNFGTVYEDYTNAMAITNPPLTSNMINIDFNTDPSTSGNILNKPDVFKAVSLIHEVLHAEMYRKMLDALVAADNNQTTLDWANDWTPTQFQQFIESLEHKYFGIFNYYTRYDWNENTPNNAQHQQMAQHYRNVVKQALTEYDPSLTETQKEALSWIGLNTADIKAWQLKSPQEQQAIKDQITNMKNTFPNGCN